MQRGIESAAGLATCSIRLTRLQPCRGGELDRTGTGSKAVANACAIPAFPDAASNLPAAATCRSVYMRGEEIVVEVSLFEFE